MDIGNLKLFRHLAGTLHFARTSKACFVSPSALTRVIQRLESQVGQPLFIRDKRRVELTPAGEAFENYAEDVLHRWDLLQTELSSNQALQGELALYCSVTAAYGILPRLLAAYRKAYPDVQIRLETGDPAKALTKLSSQEADAVITALPDTLGTDLVSRELFETPLVFIAPVESPEMVLSSGDAIDWEKTPLIFPDRGLSRERIETWLAREHVAPKVYSHVAGNEAIIVMVGMGCGVGLVPRLVLEKSPFLSQVRILKNAPVLPPFIIGVCTRKRNLDNPRVKALWDIARNNI